ncbi:MAG: hypothetical protein J6V90_04765 [Treponema sp.]|nr:hypothetical protein [Treponema sp.]
MKLIKRFSALRKGLGTAALVSALFVLGSCDNMTSLPVSTMTATASKTLYAPTFPEYLGANGKSPTYSERYYTVSQGLKNKISLSWNKVEIAKYYEVYAALNINDTFVKVGEPTAAQFEDSVASGTTYYYKVRAVNSKGEFSEFSSVVRGTSLAKPAITDIKITDTSATVFWYMGNVGIDSYVKSLIYEVHAFKGNEEKVTTIKAWDEVNQSIVEEYTFENLSGHTDYKFRVDAYIASEQNSVEKSPEVSKETLSLYTPVSPEFTASQGESTQQVKLIITLPSKIQVQTTKSGIAVEEDYPICFEIQRKRSTEEIWATIVSTLYYTGSTEKPTGTGCYDAYKDGAMIEYDDTSAIRGAKYDYRIISCVDINYSSEAGLDYLAVTKSRESLANTAQGWSAAMPEFHVRKGIAELSADGSAVLRVPIKFNASWNDMGKAADYKFAIEYERSYDNGASTETDWLLNSNLAVMMKDLEEVCSLVKTYDLTSNPDDKVGTYTFTLYVFPAKYTDPSKIKSDYLAKKQADGFIGISLLPGEPKRDLKAEGGWTDHTLLTWTVEEGVDYRINWSKLDADDNAIESGVILGDKLKDGQGQYTGKYEHKPIESGYTYSYAIIANNSTPGNDDGAIPRASTLGKPVITFDSNTYTSITVSWTQALAAEKYEVTLGSAGNFGNGATFIIDKTGAVSGVPDGLTVTPSYDDPSKTYALTITKPYGYNDASLSGKAVPLKITAISEVDAQNNVKGKNPDSKDVWTIGPAALNIKGTESYDVQNDSIKITWKKLERANGYVVYRMRPKMTRNTDSTGVQKDEYASFDAYYVNATGTAITPTTADLYFNASDGTFTLTDNYKKANSNGSPELNQQYLALGIPFTYTVLPVMAQQYSDVEEISYDISELKYPAAGDAYKNIATAQAEGYTVGYGIALEATKAEYPNMVVLNWELPKSATDKGLWPNVYWRNKNSDGAWTRLNLSVNASTQSVSLVPDDRVQAREYAVTYSDSMDSSDANGRDVAYDSYQKTLFNTAITNEEPKCVGYMFTMPQIMPIKQDATTESETETVTWNFYDYQGNRAVGGSDIAEYILELKNLNCSGTWWPIYTYDKAGKNAVKGSKDWYDVTLVTSVPADGAKQVTVNVTPTYKTNSGKYHDGLLKVQRDYKHYYRIRAKRTNRQGDEIFATSTDYAYRMITEDEAKKCINLIIADAMHQAGVGTSTSVNTDAPTTCGNFTLIHKTGGGIFADGKCRITTGTGGYNHGFLATPGDQANALVSAWNVTASSDYGGAIGSSVFTGTFIKNIPSTSITYSHETGLPSYKGSYTISGTCDGTEWFPYKFNDKDYSSPITSINTSLPAYQGLWWEIRQGGNPE